MTVQHSDSGSKLELGRKYDNDKDPWHLAPWDAFRAIVKVLAYGANKYEPRNWEAGMDWSRVYSALQRHLTAWWEGEAVDAETNMSHLWHAGCCIVFLIAYELRGVGKDDRPTDIHRKTETGTWSVGTHQSSKSSTQDIVA
jgi:hypothetical protein